MVASHLDRSHRNQAAPRFWPGAEARGPWESRNLAPAPPPRPSTPLRAWLSRARVTIWPQGLAWLEPLRVVGPGAAWLFRRDVAANAPGSDGDAAAGMAASDGPDVTDLTDDAAADVAGEAGPDLPEPPSPAPTRDDAYLIRTAQAGDLDAFNLLVLRYERPVFNVCLRLLRDVAGAEDVTQDTFVRAWQSLHTFRGEVIRPWLFRIATNRCYDLIRVRSRRPAGSLDAEPYEIEPIWSTQGPADESPDAHSLRRELSIHLERALAALPDDQRTVVLLSDVQGCDYREVAEATGAALGTVKSRLSRARARLRQVLQDDPEAGELFDRYRRHYDDQGEASQS